MSVHSFGQPPARRAPLARRAPAAKVAAVALLSLATLLTRDIPALLLVISVTLPAAPAFGISPWGLLRRSWPLLAGAASVVLSLALFAADRSGTVLLDFGPFMVTTTVLTNATSLALRLFAVALPSILVFATTDPTDLADSLIQHARVSARFAIGALAAFRLVAYFQQEWRMIAMARRARGVEAGGNPLGLLKVFASTAFGLLVGAIRRGTRLALAMDARGFDAQLPRTVARPMPWSHADTLLILAGALLGTLTLLIAS